MRELIKIGLLCCLQLLGGDLVAHPMLLQEDAVIYFCEWESVLLESPFDRGIYQYLEWYKDGQKINENINMLTVNEAGIYEIYAYTQQSEASELDICSKIGKIELRTKICREICNNNQDDDNDGDVDCADLECYCNCLSRITGNLSPAVYDDHNTPQDIRDDTFSFQLTANGQGSGWQGGGQTGNYGEVTTFGPYSVGNAAAFKIFDTENSSCFFSVSVNIDPCIYLETCTCCATQTVNSNN